MLKSICFPIKFLTATTLIDQFFATEVHIPHLCAHSPTRPCPPKGQIRPWGKIVAGAQTNYGAIIAWLANKYPCRFQKDRLTMKVTSPKISFSTKRKNPNDVIALFTTFKNRYGYLNSQNTPPYAIHIRSLFLLHLYKYTVWSI